MFEKVITVAPWGTKLFLWYGHHEEVVRKCTKIGAEFPPSSGLAGTTFNDSLNAGIVWVSPREPLLEEKCLIHELIHFSYHMFACINLREAEGSNESQAYQVDHLYGELITFIRKHHDHYEIKA